MPVSTPHGDVEILPPHPQLSQFYDCPDQKRDFVRGLFDHAAEDYERLESLMSLGSGSWYRRHVLLETGLKPGMRILDVAVGTGLLAREAVTIVGKSGCVIGIDPSEGMLAEARKGSRLQLVRGCAEELPFADNTFDFLSMGYALRHVSDLAEVFRRYLGVLRPGGTVCIMEMIRPQGWVTRLAFSMYVRTLVPGISRLVGAFSASRSGKNVDRLNENSRRLWDYYLETMKACVSPETVLAALRHVGFEHVRQSVDYGIFSNYIGKKK